MPLGGQIYISNGSASSQARGNLWLSEVLGAELIMPSYKMITVQITGYAADPDADVAETRAGEAALNPSSAAHQVISLKVRRAWPIRTSRR